MPMTSWLNDQLICDGLHAGAVCELKNDMYAASMGLIMCFPPGYWDIKYPVNVWKDEVNVWLDES